MSGKKVTFGTKPNLKERPPVTADDWVESRVIDDPQTAEPIKRLTLDIPASLHARIKSTCALRGVKMVDAIRELLEEHFKA